MKNIFVMTAKGHQNLTGICLEGLRRTAGEHVRIVIVDAGEYSEKISSELLNEHTKPSSDDTVLSCYYLYRPRCGITEGWNIGIFGAAELYGAMDGIDNISIWLVNNDIIFRKSGWLQMMHNKLIEPNVGIVGTYAMAASGYRFVTGAIWGFKLKEAMGIAENGKILDEQFNFSYQDVDLSVRMEKAGYEAAAFFGIEFGDDPYMTHLVSQTSKAPGAEEYHAEICKQEEAAFDRKHGRKA